MTRSRSVSLSPTYSVAASHRPTEISASTISLLRPERPSERRLEIFVQSSAKPTSAVASAVASTTRLTAR